MTRILSFLGWAFISLLGMTLRIRDINAVKWVRGKHIFAFWHGEQFIPCYTRRDEDAVIMSSLSKDGEIQAGIMSRLRYKVVRGSTTRGGERALVEMIRYVRQGYDAGFAVDGPKGPCKKVKPGVIYLAKKCGIPIIPMGCSASKSFVFAKAWDKYELPVPFSKAVAVYGSPVEVKPEDNVEEKTLELEKALEEVSVFSRKYYWSKDIREYLEHHPRPRILIVQPSRIGDVVFTLPSVSAIRKKYPNAWIGWLVDERCAKILEGNRDVDEIIIIDRRKLSLSYLLGLYRNLRSRKIDLSIDFHGLFKSAFLVKLAGAKFRLASSSTNGMREFSWLFSKEIKPASPAGRPAMQETHCVDRHFAVARYLGCPEEEKSFNIEIGKDVFEKVENIFAQKGLDTAKAFAAVHPGGGWIARRWPAERYSELTDRLSKQLGLQIILVGGKEGGAGELGLNEEVISRSEAKIFDLTGLLDLKELAVVLKKCAVFIANEAGPMHIATALKVPAVAIIGPTDPERTGPYGVSTKIIRHKVSCQPCRNRNCRTKECMELVTVDEVFEAVKEKLKV